MSARSLIAGAALVAGIAGTLVALVWFSGPHTPAKSTEGQLASISFLSSQEDGQKGGEACQKLRSGRWKNLRSKAPYSKKLYRYAKRVASCDTLLGFRRPAVKKWLGKADSSGPRGQSWVLGEDSFGSTQRLVVEYHGRKVNSVYVVK